MGLSRFHQLSGIWITGAAGPPGEGQLTLLKPSGIWIDGAVVTAPLGEILLLRQSGIWIDGGLPAIPGLPGATPSSGAYGGQRAVLERDKLVSRLLREDEELIALILAMMDRIH
jgi:hypothetical protein